MTFWYSLADELRTYPSVALKTSFEDFPLCHLLAYSAH